MRRAYSFKGVFYPALAACLFILPALTAGCSKEASAPASAGGKNPDAASAQAISVKTAVAEARPVQRSVEAVGTLLGWDEVTVSSEIAGTVERIQADLGDRVKAGDVLAVLDQREARLNLEDAEAAHQTNVKTLEKERARLEDARTTFKRYDELMKQDMVSQSQFDAAKMQHDVAAAQLKEAEARTVQSEARLNIAKKRLTDTVIKSPISGEVGKRFVSAGEAVKERTGLFLVVSTGELKFRGTVPEIYVPELKIGADVSVSIEAFRDRTFKGALTRLSPVVSADTRTLEIEAVIPNPEGILKPGFFARGAVITKKDAVAVFVPEAAVYSFAGVTKIYVADGGKASERQVSVGARSGDMVEIIGNVKPGEQVAVTGLAGLFDGAQVAVAGKTSEAVPAKEGVAGKGPTPARQ